MDSNSLMRLSAEELQAEAGTALPAKEVISLLDLNIDVDLALALAAPIDLAVAANANVALPIDAAVSANVLSSGSTAAAGATQGVMIDQLISGQAIANADQTAAIDQPDAGDNGGAGGETGNAGSGAGNADTAAGNAGTGAAGPGSSEAVEPAAGAAAQPAQPAANVVDDVGGALDGGLLNVDAQVSLDADLAAPVAGAVAANANVAAPIDAAVAANVGSVDSEAVAVADQTAIINQNLQDVTAEANAEQDADVGQ